MDVKDQYIMCLKQGKRFLPVSSQTQFEHSSHSIPSPKLILYLQILRNQIKATKPSLFLNFIWKHFVWILPACWGNVLTGIHYLSFNRTYLLFFLETVYNEQKPCHNRLLKWMILDKDSIAKIKCKFILYRSTWSTFTVVPHEKWRELITSYW